MLSIREFSRRLLGRLALPQPVGERTLNLYATDEQIPDLGHRCLCSVVAYRYWRAAHENGCTRIKVHCGPAHVHEFETLDLYRKVLGRWVAPVTRIRGITPRWLATRGFEALGEQFEPTRTYVNVPVALCGRETASKETV